MGKDELKAKQERIREGLYDIALAIRTEGIVGGKTKRFAESDAEDILAYLASEGVMIKAGFRKSYPLVSK